MSKLKIDRIELTTFEIEIKNVEENKSGIGIIYKPGSKNKHLRFGIRILIMMVMLESMFRQEEELKLLCLRHKLFPITL